MSSISRSRRPYLIRAIYAWAVDNGYTPYLLVTADYPGVAVPKSHVKEGRITLDLSPMAVRELNLEDEPLFFSARFGGASVDIVVPSGAVLAIYARENGEGIVFGEPEPLPAAAPAPAAPGQDEPPTPPKPGGRPKLRVVK
ncbi:MAG: ClpXP protease specificity-enhancing factor [Nevskia sp.]|nr:ClpXP protease specificity-enhancing factor [Nevskia sp.]